MKIKVIVIGLSALFLGACKKNYSCECRNSNGVYPAGDTYDSKNNAEDKCKSLSSGDTNCYVK